MTFLVLLGPTVQEVDGPFFGGLVHHRFVHNENTVLTFSTEVSVGGRTLPAGSYGLHMIPTASDWTVIFSKESRAWGSFFYDEKEDAARVTVTPKTADFQERLLYTLDDPTDRGVVATLRWEKVAVPIPIEVNTPEVVAASLRTELRGLPGFSWQSFAQAASWCARNDVNLDEAQTWYRRAAKAGHSEAMFNLGALLRGLGESVSSSTRG